MIDHEPTVKEATDIRAVMHHSQAAEIAANVRKRLPAELPELSHALSYLSKKRRLDYSSN